MALLALLPLQQAAFIPIPTGWGGVGGTTWFYLRSEVWLGLGVNEGQRLGGPGWSKSHCCGYTWCPGRRSANKHPSCYSVGMDVGRRGGRGPLGRGRRAQHSIRRPRSREHLILGLHSPSTMAGLAGSMQDTISARSVKEALGQVRTWGWGEDSMLPVDTHLPVPSLLPVGRPHPPCALSVASACPPSWGRGQGPGRCAVLSNPCPSPGVFDQWGRACGLRNWAWPELGMA